MTDFDEGDIGEMRRDGSLREFLRFQSRPTRKPPEPAPRPVWHPPDHRPGAWPPGTRPPTAPAPIPGADWTAALDEYRAWAAAADRTDDNTHHRCECGACPEET